MTATGILHGASELMAGPIQWTVAEGGNDHWYELVMPSSYQDSYTWAQARQAADSMSFDGEQGYLATVTSAGENQFLQDNYSSQLIDIHGPNDHSKYAWIGLFAATPYSGFQWVTGEQLAYTNWAPGEPNFYGLPLWQNRALLDTRFWEWTHLDLEQRDQCDPGKSAILRLHCRVRRRPGPERLRCRGVSVPEPSTLLMFGGLLVPVVLCSIWRISPMLRSALES